MEPTPLQYRPDIDGLRALAILPVIWFHSGLPGLPGGFTGVDTFFVISGYLITLIIHRDAVNGSFSFARFYERRVRRIAPALLLMTAAATAAAFALLLSYELEAYARTAVTALAMVSNIYFWRANSYFALADSIAPMLHTWSLGVEEQFYLLFPAVLIIAERMRVTRVAVALLGIASFALCVAVTALSPSAAFFLLPTRGWELMAGAALAVGPISIPQRFATLAGVTGVLLILGAALLISTDDPFPGWRALAPAMGAALVIGAGPDATSNKLLSSRPLVVIGRVSYSLYLWHWPIFVFLRHWQADPRLPPTMSLAGIALTFLFAALSYRWVEQPARRRSTSYRTVLAVCAVAAVAILLALAAAIVGRGFPQRFSPQVTAAAARRNAFAPLAQACTDLPFDQALARCRVGQPGAPAFVVWGDSHAAAISEGVAAGMRQPGLIASRSVCAPTTDWFSPLLEGRDVRRCREFNEQAIHYIERQSSVSTVVLSAYWAAHARAGGAAFWQSMHRSVDRLLRDGKRVVVIAGIPEPGVDAPWAAAIRARFGRAPLRLTCSPAEVPLERATIIDVSADFCGRRAEEMFIDDDHISRFAGLTIIAPEVALAHVGAPKQR